MNLEFKQQIQELINLYEKDFKKFSKENLTAGTRIRNLLRQISNLSKSHLTEVSNKSKEIKEKRKNLKNF